MQGSPRCLMWSRTCTLMTSATSWSWYTGVCICFHMCVVSDLVCLCDICVSPCRIQASATYSLRAHTGLTKKGWGETFLLKMLKEIYLLGRWDSRHSWWYFTNKIISRQITIFHSVSLVWVWVVCLGGRGADCKGGEAAALWRKI